MKTIGPKNHILLNCVLISNLKINLFFNFNKEHLSIRIHRESNSLSLNTDMTTELVVLAALSKTLILVTRCPQNDS